MATAARQLSAAPPLSLDQATTELRFLVGKGRQPHEAVDEFLALHEIDSDATAVLIRSGLIRHFTADFDKFRSGRGNGNRGREYQRYQTKSPHGRQAWAAALAIPHVGADGTMRPLGAFTTEDWGRLLALYAEHAQALERRVAVGPEVLSALAKARVETLNELPVDKLRPLAARIDEAWRA